MDKHARGNDGVGWFQFDGAGRQEPVAVDFADPAAELESREEGRHPGGGGYSEEAGALVRRLFELCALRADGKLHTPAGMAARLCCLASLLQVYPMDGMPFPEIARHCGLSRAAVSKTMLELTALTGIRSRQQRSDRARRVYSARALQVHARRKSKRPDAPAGAPGHDIPIADRKTRERASRHE